LGLHKEVANRLVSPFLMVNSIITATDFDNFFVLRISDGAQSDIFELASKMRALLESSIPEISNIHVPLVDDIEIKKIREAVDIIDTARNGGADNNKIKLYALASRAFNLDLVKVAVGRCARVSYLTHIGNRDYTADIKLHDNLLRDRHMSPFEHVAVAANKDDRHANLTGWYSYRSNIDRISTAARNRKIGKGE